MTCGRLINISENWYKGDSLTTGQLQFWTPKFLQTAINWAMNDQGLQSQPARPRHLFDTDLKKFYVLYFISADHDGTEPSAALEREKSHLHY